MTTFSQCRRGARRPQPNFKSSPGLLCCPQRRGRIQKMLVIAPRKPNSARRKAAKVKLTTGRCIITKIAGSGHMPAKFAVILARGKGFKDTPNAKYTAIRGALECMPIFNRNSRRSVYGVKRE